MSRYRVIHATTYRYESPVSASYGQSCLLPRSFEAQQCRSSTLTVEPAPLEVRERTDWFGNRVHYFEVTSAHDLLRITATSEVDVAPDRGAVPSDADRTLDQVRNELAALDGVDRVEAAHHLLDSPRAPVDQRVRDYAASSFHGPTPLIECLTDLMARVNDDFEFDAKATTVTSTLDDLFTHRAGVCQDFTHLVVACLRAEGIPARYVSGYLETEPPPGKTKLVGADVSHAWAGALIPGAGWLDLDPTNDQFVSDRYVTTGWGRDYGDVPPLKGVIYSDGAMNKLEVSVDVTRID